MKRISVLVLLVVCLAIPASARTHDRDAGGVVRQRDIVERVVSALKRFSITANSWMLGTPKP